MADEIIIDSIKKMIGLKMSDDDIMGSLIDAGLDYNYAQQMLDYVKYHKVPPNEEDNETKEEEEDTAEDGEDINEEYTDNEIPKDALKKDSDFDDAALGVWQEGIITIVNQKLDDIKRREDRIGDEIKTEVKKVTDDELKKMKTIIDSQRTLLLSKITSTLDSKSKEILDKSNANLLLSQQQNKQVQEKLEDINEDYKKIKDLERKLTEQVEEFNSVRENAKEIINNMQSDFKKYSEIKGREFENKVRDLDKKLNNALDLAAKILEGLVTATKKKLDDYYEKKSADLLTEINSKRENALPSELENKIDGLIAFKEQYAKMMTKVMQDIKELKTKKK